MQGVGSELVCLNSQLMIMPSNVMPELTDISVSHLICLEVSDSYESSLALVLVQTDCDQPLQSFQDAEDVWPIFRRNVQQRLTITVYSEIATRFFPFRPFPFSSNISLITVILLPVNGIIDVDVHVVMHC